MKKLTNSVRGPSSAATIAVIVMVGEDGKEVRH